MLDLSIIIVSYNAKNILRACLQAINCANLQVSYEVIVVDNASCDGSAQMVKEDFPRTVLIRNGTNNMFAKANNQAIKMAAGKCFLLLNSDCIIERGSIETLYAFLNTNQPRVACVGPRLLNKDRTVQSEGHVFYTPWYAFCKITAASKWPLPMSLKRRILPRGLTRFDAGHTRPVGWVTGAAMMISAKAFAEIGILDENFYFYGEDSEWCYRAWRLGYEVWVYPDSTIVHLGGMSTTAGVLQKVDQVKRAQQLYFMQRTGGAVSYCAAALIFLLAMPVVFAVYALTRRDLRPIKGLAKHAVSVLKISLWPMRRRSSRLTTIHSPLDTSTSQN
ncbi:MAG: glycosyltransferase family 2 protein [Rhodopirellula sp.]|nr:glycosyltransferase family 2 protein [Rhodopirellula sp.]